MKEGPLAGLLVVSVEQAVAAPYCSCKLAEAGARVIKVERPEGDFARAYDQVAKGESAYFVWLNRGKESIALDLKDEADRAVLAAMLQRADILIQNLAPGAMARLGFGAVDMRAKRPELITVDISGYGEEGPYARMKAYDLLVQAETGLAAVTGRPEGPGRVGVSACDVAAGMYAYMAVLEAVLARRETGEGRALAVSLFDALADWMTVPLLHQVYGGAAPKRVGLNHPSIAPYGAYPAADGEIVIAIQNEREWVRLCSAVLEKPELASEARFDSNSKRVANREALDAEIEAVFKRFERAALTTRLLDAGIAFGAVNEVADLAVHPQLRRAVCDTPSGEIEAVAPPVRIGGRGLQRLGRVPALDEQGLELRREFSG